MIIYSDTEGKRLNLVNVKEIKDPYIASSQYEDVEAPDGQVFRRRIVLYKLEVGRFPYVFATEITRHLNEGRFQRRYTKAKYYCTDIEEAVAKFEDRCNKFSLPYRSNPVSLTYARGY